MCIWKKNLVSFFFQIIGIDTHTFEHIRILCIKFKCQPVMYRVCVNFYFKITLVFTYTLTFWYSLVHSYTYAYWVKVQRQLKMLMRQHGPSDIRGKNFVILIIIEYAYWKQHFAYSATLSKLTYTNARFSV